MVLALSMPMWPWVVALALVWVRWRGCVGFVGVGVGVVAGVVAVAGIVAITGVVAITGIVAVAIAVGDCVGVGVGELALVSLAFGAGVVG